MDSEAANIKLLKVMDEIESEVADKPVSEQIIMVCRALATRDQGPETLAAIIADLYLMVAMLVAGAPETLWPTRIRGLRGPATQIGGELSVEEAQNILGMATPMAMAAPAGK